jgi:NADH-quinone oxidoreductase subunit C
MTAAEIAAAVVARLGAEAVSAQGLEGLHPWIGVPAERWAEVARFLRDDPALRLDLLRSITGLDYPDKKQLCAAYDLMSFNHLHELCVKVFVARDQAVIPSVSEVWRAADWHERETYDLLGIVFTGHPDSVTDEAGKHPRRILLPDDWVGFPLRKDYVFPREYQGVPGSVEIEWEQKPNYPR